MPRPIIIQENIDYERHIWELLATAELLCESSFRRHGDDGCGDCDSLGVLWGDKLFDGPNLKCPYKLYKKEYPENHADELLQA